MFTPYVTLSQITAPGSTQCPACSCPVSTVRFLAHPDRTPGLRFAGTHQKMRTHLQGADWDQVSSCTAFQFRWGTRLHDDSDALRQKCELPANRKQKTSGVLARCS
jgi:hypothetical protein